MPKKLFLLLGTALVIGGLIAGLYLSQRQQILKSQADADLEPKDVQITNLSESSATISWITSSKATSGVVLYGQEGQGTDHSASDKRDSLSSPGSYKVHAVVLEDLEPSNTYAFQIQSGSKTFTPLQSIFTTLSPPTSPPPPGDPLFGKTLVDGNAKAGVIVYLYLGERTTPSASTLSTTNGTWTMDVTSLRPDASGYYTPNPTDDIRLVAFNGDAEGGFTGKIGQREASISILLGHETTTEPKSQVGSRQPPSSTAAAKKKADLNLDGQMNALDASIFIQQWQQKKTTADLNGDGNINALDYSVMLGSIAP